MDVSQMVYRSSIERAEFVWQKARKHLKDPIVLAPAKATPGGTITYDMEVHERADVRKKFAGEPEAQAMIDRAGSRYTFVIVVTFGTRTTVVSHPKPSGRLTNWESWYTPRRRRSG